MLCPANLSTLLKVGKKIEKMKRERSSESSEPEKSIDAPIPPFFFSLSVSRGGAVVCRIP